MCRTKFRKLNMLPVICLAMAAGCGGGSGNPDVVVADTIVNDVSSDTAATMDATSDTATVVDAWSDATGDADVAAVDIVDALADATVADATSDATGNPDVAAADIVDAVADATVADILSDTTPDATGDSDVPVADAVDVMVDTTVADQDGEYTGDACVPDCRGTDCGLDPVCGTQNCGSCGDDYTCTDGECVWNFGWKPDEYTVTCSDGMCLIPAGPFRMGCNSDVDGFCNPDEYPYHEVTLDAYYMDRTEVTVDAYGECVTAGVCSQPSTSSSRCNWGDSLRGANPVNCVTWDQAGKYCAWAGKRLPTEAEWEKAARGTDGRMFTWDSEGQATCDYVVMNEGGDNYGCGTGRTWDVCSKSPAGDSPYGLCDMLGNVGEWASDWYNASYYEDSPSSNPTGPVSGTFRVLRGGGFYHDAYANLRTSYRGGVYPMGVVSVLGFRCARPQQ